jgi:hypothetical protein
MASPALVPLDKVDPAQAWQPWQPTQQDPWGLQWAGHLYRRAAFGANLAELRQAEKAGHQATLDLILNGPAGERDSLAAIGDMGRVIASRDNAVELRVWWVYWMINSLHPLREKMTLFWHNHFATSINKVQSTRLMARQNQLLREHALGKFGPFLQAISKDPAMIVWLDNNSNVKGKPNENYAREVMELFSLGVGNYTEKDIREAARAFTGWQTNDDEFEFEPRFHDNESKTVLGQTGNFNGNDVVDILLKQPAAARFLVRKLYAFFISETQTPPDRLLEPLADEFRKSDYDVAKLVRTMLSSRHFFSAHAYRQRIKSPVEFVVGAFRAVVEGEVSTQALIKSMESMGQQLFAPPNVKGWPGGQTWLNTSTVLARQNFGQALAMGTLWKQRLPRGGRFDAMIEELDEVDAAVEQPPGAKKPEPKQQPEEPPPAKNLDVARFLQTEKAATSEDVVRVLLDLFLPGGVSPSRRQQLVAFVADGKPAGAALERRAREAAHAIMSMPEYQLA